MKTSTQFIGALLLLGLCSCRNSSETTASGYQGGSRDTDQYNNESDAPYGDAQKNDETAAGDTIPQENGTTRGNASQAAGTTNYGSDSLTSGKQARK